jgi:hypothetical protein
MASTAVLSPEWWVSRLYLRMMRRKEEIDFYQRYYEGDFDYPWLHPELREEFKNIMRMTRSNYMGLVIDAMVERMNLIGFRRGNTKDGSADEDIWRIWEYNRLDSYHDQGLLEAAIGGSFYYLVSPNPKDPKTPFCWIEHPSQVIVEHVPGSNRRERKAGIKAWVDDWTGYVYANLWLDDGRIYKFQTKDPRPQLVDEPEYFKQLERLSGQWQRRQVGKEVWGMRTGLDFVPIIESPNNPRLLIGGQSEIYDVTCIQDRVNKTIADRLVTQDYGAFPQRMISGWPKEDESGNAQDPIETGRTRFLTTDVSEARAMQFDAAPLDPYSAAKREDVKDIASRTKTPAHYLLGEMANVNSETLKASETGLVSKCKQRISGHSDPAEEAARALLKLAGINVPDTEKIESMWGDPEARTQAERTDALIKMRQAADLPLSVVWEYWGATPTEIKRWKELREEEQQEALMMDPAMAVAESYRRALGGAADGPNKNGIAPEQKPPGKGSAADPQKLVRPNGLTK